MIYQHFRDDEHPFVDRVLEWINRVEERYTICLTDFLDPRQQEIVISLIGRSNDFHVSFSGGYPTAERKRAIISPVYSEEQGFSLSFLELNYPKKFVSIEHPSLLGSILGLGVKREKLGDFIFSDDRIQMIVAAEIVDYLRLNLTQVGRHTVSCDEIKADELVTPVIVWESKNGFVSSLRCDAVVAEVFRLSRTKASQIISNGKLKINWKTVDKPSYEVQSGDYLSVRHYGRARFDKIESVTRRGNYRIEYSFLK